MKKSPLLIALTVFLLGITLLMVPTVGANFPRTQSQSYPDSVGIAPGHPAGAPERVDVSVALQSMGVVSPAYGTELQNNFLALFELTDPATLTNIAYSPRINAADLAIDNSLVYAIVSPDTGPDEFITFELSDPTTSTVIGPIAARTDEEWSGMGVDPADNTVYASSTQCGTRSTLYTVNPLTGVADEIGEITDTLCISAIAVDSSGTLWGVDNTTDNLVTINPETGASTVVGALDFNANFNQGLEYNENDGNLYLAGFNVTAFQAELHELDSTTGATVISNTLGDSTPGGIVQLGWLAIESPTAQPIPAIPAITLDKTVGTDAGSCATEDEIFVDAGDMVYYCYTVTNVGEITLTNHTLDDSELGMLLNNEAITLGLSSSYMVTESAMITESIMNTATWTATNSMSETVAMDTAMVTVIPENGSAPNTDIPDDNPTGVTDMITISESGVLTDLNVYLEIDHPWVGDLIVTLEHEESGMSVELVNRPELMAVRSPLAPGDCDGDDIHNTLDDEATDSIQTDCQGGDGMQAYMMGASYQPAGSLDDFAAAGIPFSGTWELNVVDRKTTQEGTFVLWALEGGVGEPEIDVAPMSIDDMLGLDDSSTHPLTISNSGDAVLAWEISSDVTWASVDTMTGTTDAAASSPLVVTFDSTGLAVGSYTGTLTINNNDADEASVVIDLMLTVEAMPAANIEVEPTEMEATHYPDEMSSQTLTISNSGDAVLAWDIDIDVAWATVDMMSDTTAAGGSSEVTVTFDSTDVEPGTYTGTLSIASNDPDEPLVVVPVELTVEEPLPLNCSAPNLPISDNNPTGVSDSITLSGDGSISDMNIYLQTTHTWVGDLIYTVKHVETDTSVTIIDRPGYIGTGFGCGGNDIDATLDDDADTLVEDECATSTPTINGSFIPNNPLAAFDGEDIAGTWQLTVSDNASGDTGTLLQWCVNPETGDIQAPEIDVNPTSMEATLYPDEMMTEMLTISNTGDADLMWEITSDVDWVMVDMMSDTTAAGGSSDVTVTFDSTGVMTGTYTGTLSIASNDPDEAMIDVMLILTVEAEPEASAEIEIRDMMIDAGQGLSQTLTISNTGTVDFNWEAFTENTTGQHGPACSGTLDAFPGTTLSPTSGITAPGEASDLMMETDTMNVDVGDYTGNACIRNTDTNNVIIIQLSMIVRPPTAVEMAELATTTKSNLPLGLALAGMMLVLAGGFVVRRRRTQ